MVHTIRHISTYNKLTIEGYEITNTFMDDYEMTDFVGYEMAKLRNDCKPKFNSVPCDKI